MMPIMGLFHLKLWVTMMDEFCKHRESLAKKEVSLQDLLQGAIDEAMNGLQPLIVAFSFLGSLQPIMLSLPTFDQNHSWHFLFST
jgi:hypothetical protein